MLRRIQTDAYEGSGLSSGAGEHGVIEATLYGWKSKLWWDEVGEPNPAGESRREEPAVEAAGSGPDGSSYRINPELIVTRSVAAVFYTVHVTTRDFSSQ
jgi:hypothetical protein